MRERRAFTLLELIVVLVIIGLLAALVGVRVTGVMERARETRIEADLATLVTAAEQYLQRHPGETAEDQAALVAAGGLAEALESPVAGYAYVVTAGSGEARAALQKGDEVYEKGDYRAEKTSSRLYLDRTRGGAGNLRAPLGGHGAADRRAL